jgi:hypothetical protein
MSLTAWEAIEGFPIDPSKSLFEILEERITAEWLWPKLGAAAPAPENERPEGPAAPSLRSSARIETGGIRGRIDNDTSSERPATGAAAPVSAEPKPLRDSDFFSSGMSGEIFVPQAGPYRFSMSASALSVMTVDGQPLWPDSEGADRFQAPFGLLSTVLYPDWSIASSVPRALRSPLSSPLGAGAPERCLPGRGSDLVATWPSREKPRVGTVLQVQPVPSAQPWQQ